MLDYKQISFFEHSMRVVDMPISSNPDFILNNFQNKKILHIGCVDSMYYKKENNLHIKLSKITNQLFGFDIDIAGLKQLQQDCPSTYFDNFNDVFREKYDIVLVPEVIEHVLNVGNFIDELYKIETKEYFITAPYFGLFNSNIKHQDGTLKELVHPDHKCWYSPYTLFNTCKKLVDKNNSQNTSHLYILKGSSVALHIK